MLDSSNKEFFNDIISSLSLEQKISQLLITGYLSEEPDECLLEWVNDYLGGLILFRHNIKSPESVLKQNVEFYNRSKLPPFISIDQEGGLVERINGLTQIPSPMGLAAIRDQEAVMTANQILGEELKLLGFNLNFTPVLDVNTESKNPIIGLRSFGDDHIVVSKYGNIVIDTMKSFGIIPVAKHFPGHGAADLDSHLTLPSLNLNQKDFFDVHLPPFISSIEHGVEMVMVCHIFFDNLSESKNLPASLSKNIISDILIEKLGFEGVVITDDLNMSAISEMFTPEEVVSKAINAGVDILLYRDYKDARKAHGLLYDMVKAGQISESRIDLSLKKILKLKYKNNLDKISINETDNLKMLKNKLSCYETVSEHFSDRAISVFKTPKALDIDFSSNNIALLKVSKKGFSHFVSEPELPLAKLIPEVDSWEISLAPTIEDIDNILKSIAKYDKVIIISYNAIFNANQEILINKISNLKETYLLAAGSVYDVSLFDQVVFSAISYGYSNNSIRSFIKLLKSEITGNSNIPVKLLLSR